MIYIFNQTVGSLYVEIETHPEIYEREPCNVVTNVLDWGIVVSEFELQSRYYEDH